LITLRSTTSSLGLAAAALLQAVQDAMRPKAEELADDLPIRIEFIETAEKVEDVLPTLYDMVNDGLIEVQDTHVVKLARKSPRPEPKLPHGRQQGPAKLMRVFMGEADRWHDEPLYDAIVNKLRMMEIAGANGNNAIAPARSKPLASATTAIKAPSRRFIAIPRSGSAI